MQINLTKKAVADGHLRLSECGTHFTNGHWACRRELLKQAPLLTTVEAVQAMFPRADVSTVPADHVAQVVPHYGTPVTFTKTRWIQECAGDDAVLFRAEDGSQLWIDRRYVALFSLEEITSESTPDDVGLSPAMVGERSEWQIIVMPKRLEFQKGLS
jgi:hypothetical protein